MTVRADLTNGRPDTQQTWWRVAIHVLAAAFLAFAFYALLVRDDFTSDGSVWCRPPIEFMGEPRPIPLNDGIAPDFAPHCWDSAQKQLRISAVLLSLMAASWVARLISRWRKRRGHVFAGVFIFLGVVAVVGDFFWLFA